MTIGTVFNLAEVMQGYLECALWTASAGDDAGTPLDSIGYTMDGWTAEARNQARDDCLKFITENERDLCRSDLPEDLIGHNFSLTRCGHGTGFWDRGLGEVGDRLTEASEKFGDITVLGLEGGRLEWL